MTNINSGIYCIENIINGKKYIGQTINFDKRWKSHTSKLNRKKEHNSFFQNSWNKYGESSFIFYILEKCCKSNLDKKERFWIKKFNTIAPNGYNANDGGNTPKKISQETRTKIRMGLLGRTISEGTKAKISNSLSGHFVSERTKNKISKNHANLLNDKNPNFGKKLKSAVSSQYFGVSAIKKYWQARITSNKKTINIKHCKTEIDAAMAYNEYVIKNKLNRPLNFLETDSNTLLNFPDKYTRREQ